MPAAAFQQSRCRIPRAAAAVVALAALAIAPQSAAASSCANANADPGSTSLSVIRKATFCLLNEQRGAHGVRSLRESGRLDLASSRHSKDMVRNHYFAHGDFVGRIRAAGYLSGAGSWFVGENIAWGSGSYGTPAGIVRIWMDSPPHRHNILSSGFRQIGIGIARGTPRAGLSDGATYTTDFGTRG
ncbi:MAG: CAP domain-containing protein [Actinobacteria bacterium]|nr:MAG: CAP domain-containing protein [Actinomycetota bacterium]TML78289.1 MAG: CAP domain-containing protein [Actinomycetota bacterium]